MAHKKAGGVLEMVAIQRVNDLALKCMADRKLMRVVSLFGSVALGSILGTM